MNSTIFYDITVTEDLKSFSNRRSSSSSQVNGASQNGSQQILEVNIEDSWSTILRREFQEIQGLSRGPSFSSSYSRIDEMEAEEEEYLEEESFEEKEEDSYEEEFCGNLPMNASSPFAFLPPSSKNLNSMVQQQQMIDMQDVIELGPTFTSSPLIYQSSSSSPSIPSPSLTQQPKSRKRRRESFDEENYTPPRVSKNRYEAVVPTPQTRVKLSPIHGIEDSDYINANFIDGEVAGSTRYYVACQAPLENTLADFWRMIWEQNCGVIVMLTDLNPDKATQYWPEEGKVSSYGNILVCHKNCFQVGEGLVVRSLLLRLHQEGAAKTPIREVVHLQYENWPDFGVPESIKPVHDLLLFVTKFKERASSTYNLGGPVVVHCSAGLGRTGTFMALHIAIQQLSINNTPCIKQIVLNLRKQRRGMVCTFQQYAMIYSFLLHFIQSTSTPSSSLPNTQATPSLLNSQNNNNRNANRACSPSTSPNPSNSFQK